ncbi:retrovirus-related Pol polyprotein from transposon 17.6 [Trichonephila clavipes]|nr:retrovirus-related Pol polyprotein from transposon 17.6 [Trichonephila clavipes]
MSKKDLVTRIARWAMLLEEFDYEIIHHPGQRRKHMDALSGYPVMVMSDNLTLTVKTVSADSVLDKLRLQQKTFRNPKRIITDRGSAFTSKAFNDYCAEEEIQHLQLAAGVPRGNGQLERIPRTLIPVLTKLSLDDPTKWYRHVDRLQRILNCTVSRSTKWTPFELLTGIQMRNKEDIKIRDLLMQELKSNI